MATKLRLITKTTDAGTTDENQGKKAAAEQCAERLGILITYLRQPKQASIGLENLTKLRRALPNLPREEDLDYVTLENFCEKLAEMSPDKDKLTASAIQRWQTGATLPSLVNIIPVALIARSTMQELYDYLFEGYGGLVPEKPAEDEIPLLLNSVRTQNSIATIAEIIKTGAERIVELEQGNNICREEYSETIPLNQNQRDKLAQVLQSSLKLRPDSNNILSGDVEKAILNSDKHFKYNAQGFTLIALACCRIQDWNKKGSPVLDPDETYGDDFRELLKMLD